jgi:hypothetical protein
MPAHTHGVTDPGHSHGSVPYQNSDSDRGTNSSLFSIDNLGTTGTSTTGITIDSAGSGTAMDFAVQYVDVIICTKD